MSLYQVILSGIVQGLTEFLPVSSSGHLVILHSFFNLSKPQLNFDIALHFGTLIAALLYFRKDIIGLLTKDKKTGIFIILGSVPAAIAGILLKDRIEIFFANQRLVAAMLILTGVWLGFASLVRFWYDRKAVSRGLNPANSVIIGLAQAAAIMPGVSRSGATIATGIALGVDRAEAFRFSFLLSIPAVGGACLLKLPGAFKGMSGHDNMGFLIGAITAGAIGLLALKILSWMVKSNRLYVFAVYCLVVGALGMTLF